VFYLCIFSLFNVLRIFLIFLCVDVMSAPPKGNSYVDTVFFSDLGLLSIFELPTEVINVKNDSSQETSD
jgi:hypothetical protein